MTEAEIPKRENRTERQRVELPFVRRKGDAGSWVYDHRVGIFSTVIVYLLAGIAFFMARIVIDGDGGRYGFYVLDVKDLPRKEPEEQKSDAEMIRQQLGAEDFSSVRNVSSNAEGKLDAGLRDDRGSQASEIYDEARAVQDRLGANRANYERGVREAQGILDSRPNQTQSGASGSQESARARGKVTISYRLEKRTATHLHVPAYQCEGGGQVVVTITVNRNGEVTGASISQSAGNDACINDMAVMAAKASRFNVDGNAPERQQGTITYLFIPQ
ncbi:MAG: energy transducer TonB [Rikenellaceae bacterium]|nr:energy transducer TonB [Rikenellaceae bacterium]